MKTLNLYVFDEEKHRYIILIPSVTNVCSAYFNKTINSKLAKMPHFIKATKRGTFVHEIISCYLKKIPFKGDFLEDDKVDELLWNFTNWSEQNHLLKEHKTGHSEHPVVGALINDRFNELLIVGGTIDYFNTKTKTLYEWKTSSTSTNLKIWKLQTRIYAHLINQEFKENLIETIIIYNLNTNEEFKFKYEVINEAEMDELMKQAIKVNK